MRRPWVGLPPTCAGRMAVGGGLVLAALLLGGLFAAPIATVALFIPTRHRGNAAGAWPWIRRAVYALVSTAVLVDHVIGCLVAVGVTHRNITAACIGLVLASLAWLPATRSWNARAHLCWSSTTFLFAAYLAFMIHWTFVTPLGIGGTTGGVVLWLLEVFAALLGCAYLWELCDAIGRENWLRRVVGRLPAVRTDGPSPFVSSHVPAHYEPPDMVIATLKS